MNTAPFARVVAFVALLALLLPTAAGQHKNKKRPKKDPGDSDNLVAQEHGLGSISLGATAKGRIVFGFYNMISFEAVAGAEVSLALKTRNKRAKLVAELIDPLREKKVKFVKVDGNDQHVVLEGHLLEKTGVYRVRFGYTSEHNGDYELTSTARFPENLTRWVSLKANGKGHVELEGMESRKIKLLTIEPADGMQVEVDLHDPTGYRVDLRKLKKLRMRGSRIEITDVTIESNGAFELRLREVAGQSGRVRVVVQFKNPPLSRRTHKI